MRLSVPTAKVGLEDAALPGLGRCAFKSGGVFRSGVVFWDRIGKTPGGAPGVRR